PDPRRFDGALWREGRIVALWFDGDAVKPAGEPTIRLAGDMPGVTGRGRPKTLLPGQTWLPQSGGTRP
ncbi:MAG: hypothetical protein LBF91_05560, partial [Azoarcus sp.]|nr:hypothetical protein [Azoarcus sp.]